MRRMGRLGAGRGGGQIDEHAAVLDLDGVGGHGVRLVARLAEPGRVVELPEVPGTLHVVADQPALAEGTARMVAHAGDGAESAVAVAQRQARPAHGDGLQLATGERFDQADLDPVR
jgi:hypothetical protein